MYKLTFSFSILLFFGAKNHKQNLVLSYVIAQAVSIGCMAVFIILAIVALVIFLVAEDSVGGGGKLEAKKRETRFC